MKHHNEKSVMSCGKKRKQEIFSNEMFSVDAPDCYKHYWHALIKEPKQSLSQQMGGGSLMV